MKQMEGLIGLFSLSRIEFIASFHGLFSTVSLILFGMGLTFTSIIPKATTFVKPLKVVMLILLVVLVLHTFLGFVIYVPYRAEGGPRTTILESDRPWLHEVIFEHKEFLAFLPWLLILVSTIIVYFLGAGLADVGFKSLRMLVLASLILGLIYTLVVSSEAVLVTKFAPLK
jgi:hypothetical protein